jgi:hypothetical protein
MNISGCGIEIQITSQLSADCNLVNSTNSNPLLPPTTNTYLYKDVSKHSLSLCLDTSM